MVPIFFSALGVGFSGAMMPGPLLTYTVRQSLSAGPRAGFVITLGHALLELALLVLIFLGLDIVLKSDAAQIAIGLLGGSLLIVLGIDMAVKAYKNKISIDMRGEKAKTQNMLVSGIVISVSNPYFLLWWAIIGLGFVMQSYHTLGYLGVAVFFLGHILADFIWYGLISVVVGTTRRFIKEKPYRIVVFVLGGLLIFFGARFIYDAVMRLIQP